MTNINNNDKENMLLSGKSLDELIQLKIQEDYKKAHINALKMPEIKKITNIKTLPTEKIFSKNTFFKVFNKTSMTESIINGVQAEALLGMQESTRKSLLSGDITTFISGDAYAEFLYSEQGV